MSLQNISYARDACAINNRFIENSLSVPNASYATLTAKGREPAVFDHANNTFNQKIITIEYVLQANNAENFRLAYDRLNYLLSFRKDVSISFNDEYDKFYVGSIELNELSEKHGTWALGSFNIICKYPFKYSKTVNKVEGTVVAAGKQTFEIPEYQGTYPANPVFVIEPGANDRFMNYETGDFLDGLLIQQSSNNIMNTAVASIGSTSLDNVGVTKLEFNPNMKYTTSNFFFSDWFGDTNKIFLGTFNDSLYNAGEGLTYKAVYSTSLDVGVDDPLYVSPTIYRNTNTMNNFIINALLRVYCDTPECGGGIGVFASTPDNKNTGVLVNKFSVFDYNATVYYIIDGKVVGSDNIFLDKYNENLGLTQRYLMSYMRNLTTFCYSPISNEEKPKSNIIEPSINYSYSKPNNNVYISKFGSEYTFKVGNLETRRFTYERNSSTPLTYNKIRIGFKGSPIENKVNMHLAGLNVCSYQKNTLLENTKTLMGGQKYIFDPNNNQLMKGDQYTLGNIGAAEYLNFNNTENKFYIVKGNLTVTAEYYDVSSSYYHPKITLMYNDVYV